MTAPFLTTHPIDVETLEGDIRSSDPGAVISFQVVVRRDRTPHGEVTGLLYEAHPVLAESEWDRIAGEVADQWPGASAVARQCVGTVPVGQTAFLLIVSSPSGSDAFQACQFALDQVKSRVPLWKKDLYEDGTSAWSTEHREALLISDSVMTLPPS